MSTQVLLVSSVDKMIYRGTEWLLDVNDNIVTELGLTIGNVRDRILLAMEILFLLTRSQFSLRLIIHMVMRACLQTTFLER